MRQRKPMDDLQRQIETAVQRAVASLRRDDEVARQAASARQSALDQKNAELAAQKASWTNLLRDGLIRDPAIDFKQLKLQAPASPKFDYPKPRETDYLPAEPPGLKRLVPGKRSEFQDALRAARQKYRDDLARWQAAKDQHDELRRGRVDDTENWNADIDRFQRDYAAGDPEAVARYFKLVLAASDYPSAFPRGVELRYQQERKRLQVDLQLPPLELTPAIKSYRYADSGDRMVAVKLKRKRRKRLYADALAQICLRTLREIFHADQRRHVERIAFHGHVDAIDRSTGLPIKPYLLSVLAARDAFLKLDLTQVDAGLCIRKTLKARFSPDPAKLLPVEPLPLHDLADEKRESSLPPQAALEEIMQQLETPADAPKSIPVEDKPAAAETSDFYAPVVMSEPDETPSDIPIPPAPAMTPRPAAPRGRFVDAARRFADRVETEAEFEPFTQYFPEYADMTEAQQRWYFFWRSRYRQGERLETDLSYIYLHVYEIINLVGVDSPEAAAHYLSSLWRHYRAEQPSLDKHLPDWIADLIALHDLAPGALGWYGEAARESAAGDLDCLVQGWVDAGENLEDIAEELLFKLAKYDPRKSKFYRQHHDPTSLCQALKRGVMAFDAALRAEDGKSLFGSYSPAGTRVIRRAPFAAALHDYPASEITIGEAGTWSEHDTLGDILRDILRFSENVIREVDGYNYRLRGIKLSEERKAIIKAALMPEKPPPEISVDPDLIDQIRQDSDAFVANFNAPADDDIAPLEDAVETAPPATASSEDEPVSLRSLLTGEPGATVDDAEPVAALPGYLQRPADASDGLLTDLELVAPIIGEHTSDSAKLLRLMMKWNWQCHESDINFEFEGQFISTIFDDLNDRAHDHIGENLISLEDSVWVVEEDFRDEVEHILSHPDFENAMAHGAAAAIGRA